VNEQIQSSRNTWTAAGALALAGIAAYANSFAVPFLYDDVPAIVTNSTIRELWPLSSVLSPPPDTTASGRPLLNLSLALNHAVGGTNVWGYHAVNVLIHVLCGLTLFGILRRTLCREPLRARFGEASLPLAFSIAVLWLLHPLQTESVTYLIQRAESLMGLFYLLTLYGFIRASEPAASRTWFLVTTVCCFLGMASKEVMVSAPLMMLLYDRTFLAGSFREAWRQRRGLYLTLAATWLVLGYLVVTTGNRSGSAGFGAGMSSWTYALTQLKAVTLYLRLTFWPGPLVFDYGIVTVKSLAEVAWQALLIATLACFTVVALWRRPAPAFAGVWFFAILAPSSSIVPVVTETIAEHRMYLPLIPVLALVVLAAYARFGRYSVPVFLLIAAGFGSATLQRNQAYQSPLALWSDTLAKRPENPRAHNQMGNALAAVGRHDEAFTHFEEAVRLKPAYADGQFNLATAYLRRGHLPEALARFEETLRLKPDYVDANINYGISLMQSGRAAEAVPVFQNALRIKPGNATAHNNLGIAFAQTGRLEQAIAHFAEAARINPRYAEAHNNWGNGLRQTGRAADAILRFEEALRLTPNYAEASNNLALTYDALGRLEEAAPHYEQVLRLEPTYADGHYHLARVYSRLDRRADALTHLEETLRLQPAHAPAQALRSQLLAPTLAE
jgi:tetratricopeptide (TPR) repeat protein